MTSDPVQLLAEAEPEKQPNRRPEYLGEPSLGRVMRRPQWLLALLLVLAIAAGFAWLGKWQMGHAIRSDELNVTDTESVRPLSDVADTTRGVTELAGGVVVELGGAFVPEELSVLAPRENGGESGAWVVGHFVADGTGSEPGASLAVALGWAPSTVIAEDAAAQLALDPAFAAATKLEGRYMPPDGPSAPDEDQDPQLLTAMLPAHFANIWQDLEGPVYSGYLVIHPTAGSEGPAAAIAATNLDAVDSVPPLPPEKVNWLNVFYAIEWVVFAGFAVFFWFRLTRDAWEKEHELKLLRAEAGDDPDPESQPGADTAADPKPASQQ